MTYSEKMSELKEELMDNIHHTDEIDISLVHKYNGLVDLVMSGQHNWDDEVVEKQRERQAPRRTKVVWVDTMEVAEAIRAYCIDNLMDKLNATVFGTVYVTPPRPYSSERRVKVTFRCTSEEWRRVMAHYPLVRSGSIGRMVIEYVLRGHHKEDNNDC